VLAWREHRARDEGEPGTVRPRTSASPAALERPSKDRPLCFAAAWGVLVAVLASSPGCGPAGSRGAGAGHGTDPPPAFKSTTAAAFPLTAAANARYLVDRQGRPFPILGRAEWFLPSLSPADRRVVLDDTLARGYNSIEALALTHDPRGGRPGHDGAGNLPFLRRLDAQPWDGALTYSTPAQEAPDFATPNPAYWDFIDSMLADAQARGILVLWFPAYVGYRGGEQGWMQEIVANGPERMQRYGAWLSQRFAQRNNIVWMMGGDYGRFSAPQADCERALLTGLQSSAAGPPRFVSAEWDSESIATDQPQFGAAMTLNGAYSSTGDVARFGRAAYEHRPPGPAYLLEEPYDEEGPDGNRVNLHARQPVRRFQWTGWLSTAGGYVSGNGYVWPFAHPDWRSHLDTPGARDMARLNAFVQSIRWWELVPSELEGMPKLVRIGGGALSSDRYVAAAADRAGTLLVAYVPPAHAGPLGVDMSALSAPARARWLNPATGSSHDLGTYVNSGVRIFIPPGDNGSGYRDWVLIIERP
jgi:hypothetical protein